MKKYKSDGKIDGKKFELSNAEINNLKEIWKNIESYLKANQNSKKKL